MKLLSRPLSWLTFLSLLLSTACKQVNSVADVLLVASVEVTPASATLNPLEILQLQAIPRTEGGLELPSRDLTWASSAPTKVSVSAGGEVRALAAGGPFTITATVEGVQGESHITVLGTPSQLSITRQASSSAQSGVPFSTQPVVLVKDSRGSPLGGIVVTASIASGGGTLEGALTATSGSGGSATFSNLSIIGLIGTRRLSFSATGAPGVISSNINVAAGPASQLTITTQPGATALENISFVPQPVVQLRDAAGNAVSQSGVTVTVAINAATTAGSLSGNTSVNTNGNGTANFSNLKVNKAGSYSLKFTAPGLGQVVSGIIRVI